MRVRIYKGSLLASLLSLLGTGSLAIGAGLCIGKEILAGIIFVVMGFLLLAWAEKIADRREDKKREMEQMLFETREERQRAIVSIEHRNKIIKGFIVFSAVTLLLGGILETVGSMAEPKYQKTETFLSNKKAGTYCEAEIEMFLPIMEEYSFKESNGKRIEEERDAYYYCFAYFGDKSGIIKVSKEVYERKFKSIENGNTSLIVKQSQPIKVYGYIKKLDSRVWEEVKSVVAEKGYSYEEFLELQSSFGNVYLEAELQQRKVDSPLIEFSYFLNVFAFFLGGILLFQYRKNKKVLEELQK